MRHLLAPLAFALLGAVPAGAAPLALVASTTRLDYFAEKGEKVDVARTEEFLASLEQQFGLASQGKSTFSRYRNTETMLQATGYNATGVTLPRRSEVHSTLAFHPHELVHLAARGAGNPGVVFSEGLAVVIGDGGKVQGRHVQSLSGEEAGRHTYQQVADLFHLGGAGPDEYRVAGAFVIYLEGLSSRTALLRFFAACPRTTQAAAAFTTEFGASIQATWERFQQSLPRKAGGARLVAQNRL